MANERARGRPRLENGKDCERMGFSLPKSMAEKLTEEADHLEMPVSEIIRNLVGDWLRRRGV